MATPQRRRKLLGSVREAELLFRSPEVDCPTPGDVGEKYGAKAKGLFLIPVLWTPAFAAIPSWVCDDYRNGKSMEACLAELEPTLSRVLGLLSNVGQGSVILRSSAVLETLEMRGKFRSCLLGQEVTPATVALAMKDICDDFLLSRGEGSIGAILQTYVQATSLGHLSNEVHLSPTRNQWLYEITEPKLENRIGLNALNALIPDSAKPLLVRKPRELNRLLRSVAAWATVSSTSRIHFEWCLADNRFWLLQLDIEDRNSKGADPTHKPELYRSKANELTITAKVFRQYHIGEPTAWKKLANLNDFNIGPEPPPHRLYYATANRVSHELNSAVGLEALSSEIRDLTGDRAVIRTDSLDTTLAGC